MVYSIILRRDNVIVSVSVGINEHQTSLRVNMVARRRRVSSVACWHIGGVGGSIVARRSGGNERRRKNIKHQSAISGIERPDSSSGI